jgi:hypothetical protein
MSANYSNKFSLEIYKLIEPLLGDLMAKNVLKLQAKKIGKSEETLVTSDLPKLADGIKMGLNIFIGSDASNKIAQKIATMI